MATEKVSPQEAINRLVMVHEASSKRIEKLEQQLALLLQKLSSPQEKISNPDIMETASTTSQTTEIEQSNSNKIDRLEHQIDKMVREFKDYRQSHNETTKNELKAMSDRIDTIQSTTTTYFDETFDKHEENKQQLGRMYSQLSSSMNDILHKLGHTKDTGVVSSTQESNTQHRTTATDWTPTSPPRSDHEHSATQMKLNLGPQPYQPIATTPVNLKHSIIIPPASAAPAFHGKNTESPTQFLIRVQEYAESVHSWDRNTLLSGISQFLRDAALEWYCQMRMTYRRPQTWSEFTEAFLSQYNSPVRRAKLEQQWHECRQREDETINEFVVRLRALWREQKPNETEVDLVKHLFCRMRNDLLNMVGTPRNISLDELLSEIQQIEEILFRRNKHQRTIHRDNQSWSNHVERSQMWKGDKSTKQQSSQWRNKEYTSWIPAKGQTGYQPNEDVPKNYRGGLEGRTSHTPM